MLVELNLLQNNSIHANKRSTTNIPVENIEELPVLIPNHSLQMSPAIVLVVKCDFQKSVTT